jgi:cytochrome c-type biogenesis protein CcmH/NrfG
MQADALQTLIDDASADFALGENESALAKLQQAVAAAPESFEAWHALAEVHFSQRHLDDALVAADHAHRIQPGDLFINTTLSRIVLEAALDNVQHGGRGFATCAMVLAWCGFRHRQ